MARDPSRDPAGTLLGRRNFLLGRRNDPGASPPPRAVRIGPACLALRGVACMTCRDICPQGAIRFTLARGGARPVVEAQACTGCAACLPACPASALLPPTGPAAHG